VAKSVGIFWHKDITVILQIFGEYNYVRLETRNWMVSY